jgi:hypothetical protein
VDGAVGPAPREPLVNPTTGSEFSDELLDRMVKDAQDWVAKWCGETGENPTGPWFLMSGLWEAIEALRKCQAGSVAGPPPERGTP